MTANNKLAEASKLKSQFLANVNHELAHAAELDYRLCARLVRRETERANLGAATARIFRDLLRNAERLYWGSSTACWILPRSRPGKIEVQLEPVLVKSGKPSIR